MTQDGASTEAARIHAADRAAGPRDAARLRWAAVLFALTGLGFGIATPLVIGHIEREGRLPVVAGIRALGDGPFDNLGFGRMVPLAWGLTGLAWLEVLTAGLLWRRRIGARLAIALLPPSVVFWIGFALPFPPPVALARLALLFAGRRALV